MEADSPKITPGQNLCRNCGRCVQSCPRKAIDPKGVDAFRCRNISPWIPPPFIPFARWLLSQESLQRLVSPCALLIARHATMRCSRCVTGLPVFQIRGLCKGLKNLLSFLKCGELIVCEKS